VLPSGTISLYLKGEDQNLASRSGFEINEYDALDLDTEALKLRMKEHAEERAWRLRAKELHSTLNTLFSDNGLTRDQIDQIEKIIGQ
jgi:post-segregation antitoxin (ccd killing protein)